MAERNLFYSILTSPIFQMIIGALITWLAAKYYYQAATKDLKDESAELRRLIDLIIRQIERMEGSGLVKVIRDESGKPIGLNLFNNIHANLSFEGSTSPQKAPSEKEKKDYSSSSPPPPSTKTQKPG
jgi:hypothetical protein